MEKEGGAKKSNGTKENENTNVDNHTMSLDVTNNGTEKPLGDLLGNVPQPLIIFQKFSAINIM